MNQDEQWLALGLDGVDHVTAERVRLFRLLITSGAWLRLSLDRALAPTGITTQQGALLQWIQAQKEAPTLGEAARAMSTTHQNVKQIVSALVRKKFLKLIPDADDARVRRLALTARHRTFWRQRDADDFARISEWTGALTDTEVAYLVVLLRRLLDGRAQQEKG